MSKSFKILGVNHLGIAAKDPELAKSFFSEICGLADMGTDFVEDQKIHTHMFASSQHDIDRSARLEILDPKDDEEGVIPRFIANRGGGIHHVALTVDSVEAAIESMLDKGVRMVDHEPRSGAHSTKIAFVHPKATGGILVEFVEECCS